MATFLWEEQIWADDKSPLVTDEADDTVVLDLLTDNVVVVAIVPDNLLSIELNDAWAVESDTDKVDDREPCIELKELFADVCNDDVAKSEVSHVVTLLSNDANDDLAFESLTDKTFEANDKGLGLFEVESRTCNTPTEGMFIIIIRKIYSTPNFNPLYNHYLFPLHKYC